LAYGAAHRLPEAIELLERVRKGFETKLGPDHPSTLTTLNNLASAYHEARRLPEAIKLLEEARTALESKLGPDHRVTLRTLNALAGAYRDAGKLEEAIKLYEQASAGQEANLGLDHPDTLQTRNNLALAYQAAGRLPEAVKLLEQVRAAVSAKLGPDHPHTLSTLNNLAAAYEQAGKRAEAIRILEQVRASREAKLGPDDPATLSALHNLAAVHWHARELDKSIPLFEDVLKRREARLGRNHPSTIQTIASLGGNYRDAGRLDEAIGLLEEAYRGGRLDPGLAWVGNSLVAVYTKAGRGPKAAELIQELLAAARKRLPPGSPQLAGELAFRGNQLLGLKLYSEAEPLLRECLTLRETLAKAPPIDTPRSSPPVRPWQVANAQSLLGGALLGQKKYADAEPLLLSGAEGLKKEAKAIPPEGKNNIADAISRVVELYEATGKGDEATKWRSELEALRKATGG
jgi:tetratricopeptide (TPR) repeat protein